MNQKVAAVEIGGKVVDDTVVGGQIMKFVGKQLLPVFGGDSLAVGGTGGKRQFSQNKIINQRDDLRKIGNAFPVLKKSGVGFKIDFKAVIGIDGFEGCQGRFDPGGRLAKIVIN